LAAAIQLALYWLAGMIGNRSERPGAAVKNSIVSI